MSISLGKKKQLTEKQLKPLRMILQRCKIINTKNNYFYNIITKESGSGFFSNERLLILNANERSLMYQSKIPQGYLPFETEAEILATKQKQKIIIPQVLTTFKCVQIKGKISTLSLEWEKDSKKFNWILIFGNSKLMHDWIQLISSIVSNTFNEQDYKNLQSNNSQIVSNTTPINQQPIIKQLKKQQNKKAQFQESNLNQYNPYRQNNVNPLTGSQQKQPLPKVQKGNQNSGSPYQKPQISKINNNTGSQNVEVVHMNPNFSQSSLKNQNLSNPQNVQNNANNLNKNTNLGQNQNQNHNLSNPSKVNMNTNLQNSNNSKIQNSNVQNNPQNNKIVNENKNVENNNYLGVGSRQNQLNNSKQVQNSKINNYQEPSFQNSRNTSNLNQSNLNQSNLNPNTNVNINNQSKVSSNNNNTNNNVNRPGDFVEELKYLKKEHPSKFQLSNQLSKQKLDPYNEHSSNPSNKNNYSPQQQRHLNQINSQKQSPQNSYYPQPYESSQHQPKNLGRIKSTKDANLILNNEESRGRLDQISEDLQYQDRRRLNNNNRSDMQNFYDDNQHQVNEFNPNESKKFQRMNSEFPLKHQYNKSTTSYAKTNKNTDNQLYDINNRGNQEMFQPQSVSMKKNLKPHEQIEDNLRRPRQNSKDFLNPNRSSTKNFNRYSQQLEPHWNEIWLQSSNNAKKIQIYEQFIENCKKISTQIVDELPFQRKDRHYMPLDIKSPYYTYKVQNIILTLHFFENAESLLKNFNSNQNNQSPLLYDQSFYDQLKRQFYNYDFILSVTKNQGFIRVPLCCYLQYKGILITCKAQVPTLYQQVDAFGYRQKFQALQQIIKVKFLFGAFNIFQGSTNSSKNNKFLLLWNLKNLIPGIPNSMNQNYYFRKEFLLQYDQILEDLETSSQAHAFTLKHIVPELLAKFQSLQTWTISSSDLIREFHKVGVSLSYLPQLFMQTNCVYLKKLFMTQIVADVFTSILRSQLNHAFTVLPLESFQNITKEMINNIMVDCCHVLIEELLSYSMRAQGIWKTIVQQSNKRYQIIVSKQDIIPGYLLSSIVQRNNLITNFKTSQFDRTKHFFIKQNNLPKQCIIDFDIKIRRYDMENVCQTYSKTIQILEQEPSTQNYQYLISLLNLRGGYQLPAYFSKIQQELLAYLCNFIPYDQQDQYPHLRLYDSIYYEPHTYYSMKTSLLAIKWLIKKRQLQKALQIFEIKCFQNSFWLGQFNPPITEFYDFFSMYYASVGNFQDSIKLAKSSLVNTIRLLGTNGLPVADKHYQLGNIYFKIGKKQDCLKQYNKTKQILLSHQQTTIPQYGIILLKLSLLYLNFGKISQCVGNALDALKVFDNQGNNQLQEIQTFQILARAYQITRKTNDMLSVGSICSNKFNNTENPKVFQKMLKIVLFPKLNQLSTQQQKALTQLLTKLKEQFSNSTSEAFAYLHKKSSGCNITKKIFQFVDNIVLLNDDVNRKDLLRKHKSLQLQSNRVQAQQMLGLLQGVGSFIGYDFMIGAIKDSYYE